MTLLAVLGLCAFHLAAVAQKSPGLSLTQRFDVGWLSISNPNLSTWTLTPKSQFDDLSLPKTGLTSLPKPYHNLTFISYSVFDPHSPSLAHLISPYDLNCAVSAPNALLGSRTSENGTAASFEIASDTPVDKSGLWQSFTLHSLKVKPMAAPEPGTNLVIRGYRNGTEYDVAWNVWFPSGYHEPLEVRIQEFSEMKWETLRKVEIFADFGYDRLDWEFCIDDLVVEFTRTGKSDGEDADLIQSTKDGGKEQVVLQNGV
ncbi:MAG: hypothetical protein Q9164_007352 [Protoblastenia rupestris]